MDQQAGQANREQMITTAAQKAQHHNPGFRIVADGRLRLKCADGIVRTLEWNDSKQKLVLALNCGEGAEHQHYKCCTLKAVQQYKHLMCAFHHGNTAMWFLEKRRDIPDAEIRWLNTVAQTAGGVDWCHQSRADFHRGDIDFYNLARGVYLQIDEARHWAGMTAAGHTKQSLRDFTCNLKAYKTGAVVVRVHAADIATPTSVYAAIEADIYHGTVVLSSSYQHVLWKQTDQTVSYTDRLAEHLGATCSIYKDLYGNMVFY